ncbi:ArsR/SmtB family transcription factor [Geobacter pickeringii]
MEAGELCVCDLIAVLQLPQSTVSRHLSHLKNAGWLQDRRVGIWIYYSIVKQPGPVHQSLLPTIRYFSQQQEIVRLDSENLKGLAKGRSCA